MANTIPISIMAHLDVLAHENGLSKGIDVWSAVSARPDRAMRFIRGGFSIELKKSGKSGVALKNSYILTVRDIDAGLKTVSVELAQGGLFANSDIKTIVKLNQVRRKAQAMLTSEAAAVKTVKLSGWGNRDADEAPVAVLEVETAGNSRSALFS